MGKKIEVKRLKMGAMNPGGFFRNSLLVMKDKALRRTDPQCTKKYSRT
jgi:hypothetical protein